MISATLKVRVDDSALNQLLKTHEGPTGRWGGGIADRVKQEMKNEAPVYSGELRDSITYRRSRNRNELSWNFNVRAPHGRWVIQGGGHNNAKPNDFMERGMHNVLG